MQHTRQVSSLDLRPALGVFRDIVRVSELGLASFIQPSQPSLVLSFSLSILASTSLLSHLDSLSFSPAWPAVIQPFFSVSLPLVLSLSICIQRRTLSLSLSVPFLYFLFYFFLFFPPFFPAFCTRSLRPPLISRSSISSPPRFIPFKAVDEHAADRETAFY